MGTKFEDYLKDNKYKLISVEKVETPEGMQDGEWYRYVIGRGQSKIEGLQPGTLKSVTKHAETYADDLNERAKTGGSPYASRKKK